MTDTVMVRIEDESGNSTWLDVDKAAVVVYDAVQRSLVVSGPAVSARFTEVISVKILDQVEDRG